MSSADSFPNEPPCERSRIPRARGVLWFAVSLLSPFATLPGVAEEIDRGHTLESLVEVSRQERRPLADFVDSLEPIALEGSRSGIDIEIPLSPRMKLTGGEVEVHYLHAVGLRADRSKLDITWDKNTIASRQLGGLRRDGRLSGYLPDSEPSVDRYQLRITAEQRAASGDDSPFGTAGDSAAEPWTQIDPQKSWVALDYQLRPLVPRLNEVRTLVDDRLWGDYTLTVVTAPVYAIGESHFNWASRAIQRIALWQSNRPLTVRHDDRLSAVGDELVIGTRDELIGILPTEIGDQITHSFVGVYPHPDDPRHFLLVLSGTEPEGVDRAVRAFVFHSERLPPLPRIDVTGWDISGRDPKPTGKPDKSRLGMPDLARWSRDGFPGATGLRVEDGCDFWLTHCDSETMASAWMLSGKLAQVAGDVVTSIRVVKTQPEPSRHWIGLGDLDALPTELADQSPLSRLFLEGDLIGRRGVITQFESPLRKGRAASFITAEDRVLLQDRVEELISPAFWRNLEGDTVTWEPGGESPRYQRLAATFEIGEPGWFLRVVRFLDAVPWLSLLFGCAGAFVVFWLLRQPVHDPDPASVGVTRRNGNRRVSRGRRIREAARRAARLGRPSRHHG